MTSPHHVDRILRTTLPIDQNTWPSKYQPITDELRWIWDFLVFYVHSLGTNSSPFEKWWAKGDDQKFLLGPCLFSGAFTRHFKVSEWTMLKLFYGPKMISDYHLRRDEWTLVHPSPALKNPTKILPGRGKRPNYRLLKKVPNSGAAQNCRSVDWFLWGKYTYPFVPRIP